MLKKVPFLLDACVFAGQLLNESVTSSFVRGVRDFRCSQSKKFLFLQLDPFPRRIPKHYIESTFFA